jgi:CheY-like chemotaxis protein
MTTSPGLILVVDDDEDIREIVGLVLEQSGYRTVGAVDGADALERLRDGLHPALAIVDLMMPRLSGADLVRAMRTDPRLAPIPVVILSGDRAVRQISAELGASSALLKPVELEDLLAVVRLHAIPESPALDSAPAS